VSESYEYLTAHGWEHLEDVYGYKGAREKLQVLRAHSDRYEYCIGDPSPSMQGAYVGIYRRGGKSSPVTTYTPSAPHFSPKPRPTKEPERNTFSMAGYSR
jgi:hypothetical protein